MKRAISNACAGGAIVACLVAVSACSESNTEPAPTYVVDLQVDLTAETGGTTPAIKGVSTARNTGGLAVGYVYGCPASPFVSLYDAEGKELSMRDACAPVPSCPAMMGSLEPGKSAMSTFTFNGTTWDGCSPQQVSAGQYEFRVEFRWRKADGQAVTATRSQTFDWPPAANDVVNHSGVIRQLGSDAFIIFDSAPDGRHFAPMNLPEAFQRDGLRVVFSGHTREIPSNVRLAGTPLDLSSIQEDIR